MIGKKVYKNASLFGLHGDCEPEKILGQKFVLDIRLIGSDLDKVSTAISDDDVNSIVKAEAVDSVRDLIQTVATKIADGIMTKAGDAVQKAEIEFKKPCTSVSIGMPGGLLKYVSSNISKARDSYSPPASDLFEGLQYTKIRSARVFNKQCRYEVDVEVAFDQNRAIAEDSVNYSFSYTTIHDIAVAIAKENAGKPEAEILSKMIDAIYKAKPDAQRVRATIRNMAPFIDLSVDYMEYELTR